MDPVAVYEAVAAAVERARSGGGPTLIEAMTYRYRGHYEGDPQTYRPEGELAEWEAKDPLITFPQRLIAEGHATPEWIEQIRTEVTEEVEAAAQAALGGTKPDISRLYEYVYADETGSTVE
jgi:pyruvate dehydrogenase E1 component alpha subunit